MKPILFNTEMVRAILDGRKTVTRRVVKQSALERFVIDDNGELIGSLYPNDKECIVYSSIEDCTYQPGDILYVQETWDNEPVTPGGNFRPNGVFYYKADGDLRPDAWRGNWHPSIHMPREAARIFLRVTDVRVERLWDITEEQARAEGLYKGWTLTETSSMAETAKQAFMWVWDSTIKLADRASYGWIANPWVWVIAFERCEKPKEI